MPYIKQEDRARWRYALTALFTETLSSMPLKSGDLNYLITAVIHGYVRRKGQSYTTLNDVVGVLESAKAEFQRRVVAPYEDKKIKENGDL